MCEYLFFIVILSVFMQHKYFTASNCALCWSALHQQRAKNGWFMTYCTHLPHLPALVVPSKTQTTARQNGIVHLQPYFFNFQLLIFNKADWTNCCGAFFCVFKNIPVQSVVLWCLFAGVTFKGHCRQQTTGLQRLQSMQSVEVLWSSCLCQCS